MCRLLSKLFISLFCLNLVFVITPSFAEEGFIPVKNGKLYYQSFDDRPTIIVIHGGPGLDQSYLLPQMKELAKRNPVIFYDQRSSGRSLPTTVNEKDMNVQQFIQDIEALRQSLHINQFIILGHSWGGLLASEYATQYPQHVSAMILLNSIPLTSTGFKAFETEAQKRFQSISTELEQIQSSQGFKQYDPKTYELFYRTIFSTYVYDPKKVNNLTLSLTPISAKNSAIIENWFTKTYLSQPYDLRSKLKTINVPTLVIAGNDDPVPVWTEKEISDALPHAKFVLITHCGHFPYFEQPAELFKHINQFLDEHPQ